jgi:hypothetical protein
MKELSLQWLERMSRIHEFLNNNNMLLLTNVARMHENLPVLMDVPMDDDMAFPSNEHLVVPCILDDKQLPL